MSTSRSKFALMIIVVSFLSIVPLLVRAQSSSADLQATIRSQLLLDPRSANMDPKAFDALVLVLTAQAQKSGLTSHDIVWKPDSHAGMPQVLQPEAPAPICDPNSFLCALEYALGLTGNNTAIAMWIGIGLALFILICGGWVAMRRSRHAVPPMPTEELAVQTAKK